MTARFSALSADTLAFLFTDIEGSTGLWERQPEAMREALARHDALLRETVETRGGRVFKTMGDAVCAAFPTATDALSAALAAQLALQAQEWGDLGPLRVRMALHVGAAETRNGDYAGSALNRVARLLSIGHGGQTLVSQTAHDLVQDALPEGVALRDLGLHSLRDLQQPVQVYQVVHPALPADFPPLKSLDVLPTNLPSQLTSFIGREREMAEVKRLLAGTRMLTLTGAGGSGKTRLALQVAAELLEEYADGVWLVELATLAEDALVPQAVATVLGVREQPGRPLTETLVEHLKSRKTLLILDNCEHLLEGCVALASRLLPACAGVKILATSREALNATGEASWLVPPLTAPDPRVLPQGPAEMVGALGRYEAVRLFLDRAALARADFTLNEKNAAPLAQVCHRLDGIPLAIELAAARVKAMSLEQIAARLDDRFRLLTGGSRMLLPRHQTLRATIDWSYDLLEDVEKRLLRRLSVFAGGWTLDAAEAVCAGDGIESWEVLDLQSHLVDKSLVMVEEGAGGEIRYRLLGTIRQYARDRLVEASEAGAVRSRHLDWFVGVAERAAPELRGAEQALWFDRLEQEHDNFRAALEWSQTVEGGAEAGLRLAGTLYRFWYVRGYLTEGRQWLDPALAASTGASRAARARALHGGGYLAWGQGDVTRARPLLVESLALYRELGDKRMLARTLNSFGIVVEEQGERDEAQRLYEEGLAIAREIGEKSLVVSLLNNLGENARVRGDYARARALYEEALTLRLGTNTGSAIAYINLGLVAFAQGDRAAARTFFRDSLGIAAKIGDKASIPLPLEGLAGVHAFEGDPRRAARLLGWADALRKTMNLPVQVGDRADYERFLSAARGALDEQSFAAAWKEGAAMTLGQAVEHALEPVAPIPEEEPVPDA